MNSTVSEREITVLTDVSLITCIVQRGLADDVIKAAQAAGAQGATTCYARGAEYANGSGFWASPSKWKRR